MEPNDDQRENANEKEDVLKDMRRLEKDMEFEAKKCPKCGDNIPLDEVKCPSCGHNLALSDEQKKEDDFEKMFAATLKATSYKEEAKMEEEYPEEREPEGAEEVELKPELEEKEELVEKEPEEEYPEEREPEGEEEVELKPELMEKEELVGEEPEEEEGLVEEEAEEEEEFKAEEEEIERRPGIGAGRIIAVIVILIGIVSYLLTPVLIADTTLAGSAMILGAIIIVIGGNMAYESFARAEPIVKEDIFAEKEELEEEILEEAEGLAEEEEVEEKELMAEEAKEEVEETAERELYACPVCGKGVSADTGKCPHCGTMFEEE